MTADAIRAAVLDAIERGAIPAGGPSELAARDQLGAEHAGHVQGWADGIAAGIREQALDPSCCCVDGGQAAGVRCRRCKGWAP